MFIHKLETKWQYFLEDVKQLLQKFFKTVECHISMMEHNQIFYLIFIHLQLEDL